MMTTTTTAAAIATAAAETISTSTSTSNVDDGGFCRMSKFSPMSRVEFNYISSVQCYRYLSSVVSGFNPLERMFQSEHDGHYYYWYNETLPVHFDASSPLIVDMIEQTTPPLVFSKWQDCCQAAMQCCDNVMSLDVPSRG